MSDIESIKIILNNLQYTEKILQNAIVNWKKNKNVKNFCENINIYPGKKIIENLCEHPNSKYLNKEFFQPLYKFLKLYIAIREKLLAYVGKTLDSFLKLGLKAIYKYVVLTDYFTKNIKYIVLDDDPTNIGLFLKTVEKQNKYKEYLLSLSENLIGCKKKLFMFLSLISSVDNLNDEQKSMKKIISDQCLYIRMEKLKM